MDLEHWMTEEGRLVEEHDRTKIVTDFIGYDGQEGLYMYKNVADAIWKEEKVPPEWWRSLNQLDEGLRAVLILFNPSSSWFGYF